MFDLKHFRKLNNFTQENCAAYFGCAQSFISQIERGERTIPEDYISKIEADPSVIRSDSPILTGAKEKEINDDGYMNVPLVPVRGKAGYLTGFGDMEYIEALPRIPVIVDREYKGKYRCFEVDGDSMDDNTRNAICDRDIVLGREIKRELWRCKLHIKEWEFVIVHKEGITIKKIIDHEVETGQIKCHSLNPLFEDFDLNLDDVIELYNVIKIVDRNRKR